MKFFRKLLFPIALIYGLITYVRNKLFDLGLLRSFRFDFPVISVGNLSAGGNGKTPMVEYLIRMLQERYTLATLSRGYRRKTRGYIMATGQSLVEDIGDEPRQIKQKFPGVHVSVGESRLQAIPEILTDEPGTEVILLDDAFQHRALRPGLSILLTSYLQPYFSDWPLPAGDLREWRNGARRADLIVMSKCPPGLREEEMEALRNRLSPGGQQAVFFTALQYGEAYNVFSPEQRLALAGRKALVVTAIADNRPMLAHLSELLADFELKTYPDHYTYSRDECRQFERFLQKKGGDWIILCTEKDASRLSEFTDLDEAIRQRLYALPMRMAFLKDQALFDQAILNYICREKENLSGKNG